MRNTNGEKEKISNDDVFSGYIGRGLAVLHGNVIRRIAQLFSDSPRGAKAIVTVGMV